MEVRLFNIFCPFSSFKKKKKVNTCTIESGVLVYMASSLWKRKRKKDSKKRTTTIKIITMQIIESPIAVFVCLFMFTFLITVCE